ncbi:MAG: hypothetical protein HOF75_09670 [Flavobacteriaceae bacterium]|jgi:hypothetical protein|nr:hypothetical protein [Flavobacteriaceae bacterium]MBT3919571.1 hypothetical protein [Flavobacteriaceae bacterium]MBT6705952.1 hypothetical protein [Flavobacteriaceae bacterium]MBT7241895.1 hypothetical protein [Flavobacteriaceae bacterium]|tara:strand:+ start:470 stop:865 length:396 start_codon:yes stop_codon:yes gene_type:complete
MKKDLIIPIVKNIQVVATHEWDKDFLAKTWIVYLINNREDIIESVLVMSRGTSKNKKTSTLRHGLGNLLPHTGAKVELVCEEVLGFTNEYLVTFFAEGKLFDRTFTFKPYSIKENNTVFIDLMGQDCVLAV